MSYKTILVHLDGGTRCAARVAIAAQLALKHNAHLIGLVATGELLASYNYVGPLSIPYSGAIDELRAIAAEVAAAFEKQVAALGLSSVETRVVRDESASAVAVHGRYADLVIIGQTDRNEVVTAVAQDMPEFVLMNVARPLMIIPYAGEFGKVGDEVAVAWDGSQAATRAIADALPLLAHAARTRVLTFNAKPSPDGHGQDPGTDIAVHLARHGCKVEVCREESTIDIGNAMLSRVADYGVDLIVMGGYGHSRFRETLLGGVTRTLLGNMTVPVLMSH